MCQMLSKALVAVILGAVINPASSDPASDLHALISKGPAGDGVEEILTFSSKAAENLVAYASHRAGLPEEVSTFAKLTGQVASAIEKALGSKLRSLVASREMVEALQVSWKGLLSAEQSVSSGDLIDFAKGAQKEINRLPSSKGMESVTASILILKELDSTTRNLFLKLRESEKSQKSQAARPVHQPKGMLQAGNVPDTIPICPDQELVPSWSRQVGNTDPTALASVAYYYDLRFTDVCYGEYNREPPLRAIQITAPGILYSLEVTEDTDVTLTTCTAGTNYDTQISVYDSLNDNCIMANDIDNFAECGFASAVTLPALADVTYLVLVHGYGSSAGIFDLHVSLGNGAIKCPTTTTTTTTGIVMAGPPTPGGPPAIVADEIPEDEIEEAGAPNASRLPFTWLLPGAVLSIAAGILVKSFRGLSSTAMPMMEPADEESEALELSNEM